MPDPMTTNVCFGGHDLRTAFVTLSGTAVSSPSSGPDPACRSRPDDAPTPTDRGVEQRRR